MNSWRATVGPAKEVFFAQQHPPGRLGASDFTHMDEVGGTIQGQSFPHLIYHFVLTYSNCAFLLVRLIRSLLFGVEATDPITFAGISLCGRTWVLYEA